MHKICILLLIYSIAWSQQRSLDARIDSVLSKMTLDEKIGQLNQYSGGFFTGVNKNRLSGSYEQLIREGKVGSLLNVFGSEQTRKMQRIAVEQSRAKIPLIFGLDVIHGCKTTFPVPLAEASTWDTAAVALSARWQAIEASSAGIHWTFGPMVDIARDPRWGRIVEGSGEDPYLGSLMAAARVRGYQGGDLAANNTIVACAKHFAGYGGAEGGRDYNTVDMSERTFREVYLKPFKSAVDAGAGTLMASFNEIGGVPSSANHQLLTRILRDEWKFDGFVVSDWNSVGELIPHGAAKDLAQAAELGINAGVDMDMESDAYIASLKNLVNSGKVSQNTIDESVRRILRIKFRLGLFEDPYKYCDAAREKAQTRSKEIISAARMIAGKSIVLLKNDGEILPLKKSIGTVAIIGPLANSKRDPLGAWAQQGDSGDVVTVVEGVRQKLSAAQVLYEQGCGITDSSKNGFAAAVAVAKKADVVLLVLGESLAMSGEAYSRSRLDLPGVQEELAEAVCAAGKPVIVILMNGRPLAVPWIVEHSNALIEAWFLGVQSGNAVADVLFGSVNPSGKLPVTFPRSVGQIPLYYNNKNTGRPGDPRNHYTSAYFDLENTPLFPFGFGLSYSKFEYSHLTLNVSSMTMDGSLTASVDVRNSGTRAGEEVVQFYIRDLVGSVTRPVKELKGFSKVALRPGETKKVEFVIMPEHLKFYTLDMTYAIEPGEFMLFAGGNSRDVLEVPFTVTQ
ncbi:MAG: beta-glucosidase BglX [Ignavibacteriales bacterium]|nr:beta-glucosidase BglX [Ignavibacteriales bacterium]